MRAVSRNDPVTQAASSSLIMQYLHNYPISHATWRHCSGRSVEWKAEEENEKREERSERLRWKIVPFQKLIRIHIEEHILREENSFKAKWWWKSTKGEEHANALLCRGVTFFFVSLCTDWISGISEVSLMWVWPVGINNPPPSQISMNILKLRILWFLFLNYLY